MPHLLSKSRPAGFGGRLAGVPGKPLYTRTARVSRGQGLSAPFYLDNGIDERFLELYRVQIVSRRVVAATQFDIK